MKDSSLLSTRRFLCLTIEVSENGRRADKAGALIRL
ncbi:hypothetical protein NPIL_270921, partial [Nephila pilipes]